MVHIFRSADAERVTRAGYEARYIADLTFMQSLDNCGVILVEIEGTGRSSPHSHEQLQEVFVALTEISIYVDGICHNLKQGDVVMVEPGENHSFASKTGGSGLLLALKFPNIKDDKVVPSRGSED
jgi:quercetin dioxygenase-like cupin family protein